MLKMCGPSSAVILAANTPLSIGVKTYPQVRRPLFARNAKGQWMDRESKVTQQDKYR